MSSVQKEFEQFHDAIKHDEDDERAKLRDKRDILIKALRENLPDDVPAFRPFNQGSYAMRTGVVPLDGNYDIDVGIEFDCGQDKYPDPVVLKKKVRDALDHKWRKVAIRRPCVTVNYMKGDAVDYHVDLALYVKRSDVLLELAKGRENSAEEHREWWLADPEGLTKAINERFSNADDAAQFRRCIRYMKRWRDKQFSTGAPKSIALTVAAFHWFQPYMTSNGVYLDIVAMQNWVKAMMDQFSWGLNEAGEFHTRLSIKLPVQPYCDVTDMMTKAQMGVFGDKLHALHAALCDAYEEALPEDACKLLRKQFGDEFPIPPKSETAKKVAPAIISTGHSA